LPTLLGYRGARDIFPISASDDYVAQPFGGMDPAPMEGYLITTMVSLLYINGIEHIESSQ